MFTPLVWMLLTSFKPESEVLKLPLTFFPENFILDNYTKLFSELNFMQYFKNTLILVIISFAGLFFNAMTGYAFAKFEFPYKKILFVFVLATMMIPSQVTMIPVYLILNSLHLTNTILGIALPGFVAGFSVFLFRQFFTTIPDELLEAARIDGASEFRIFFSLIVPVAKPIFAVQGILTFIGAWNSFLWPLIIASDEKYYTLSVGLSLLKGQNASSYALQMAGSAIMVIPILMVFLCFQKYIVEGFTMSGMK